LATEPTEKAELLDLALAGHGGLDRWLATGSVTATITVTGALFALKGRPEGLGGVVEATASTSTPRLTFRPFLGGDEGAFEAGRVAVKRAGAEIDARDTPRAAFADHELGTAWDDLHLLYFAGYAMWNYLATPFMFTRPGFELEEIEPWHEGGETWRRLRVEFPADVPSHSPAQVFYFDREGLLRRLDYAPEVVSPQSPIPAAHYCHDHKDFSGLVVPTRRRVFRRHDDGAPATDQPVVELEVKAVTVTPGIQTEASRSRVW
jgi:hypothetical protein